MLIVDATLTAVEAMPAIIGVPLAMGFVMDFIGGGSLIVIGGTPAIVFTSLSVVKASLTSDNDAAFSRASQRLRAYTILLIVNATLTDVIAALTGVNAMPTVVINTLTIVEGLTSIVKASSLIVFESKTTIFAVPSIV